MSEDWAHMKMIIYFGDCRVCDVPFWWNGPTPRREYCVVCEPIVDDRKKEGKAWEDVIAQARLLHKLGYVPCSPPTQQPD